MRHTVNSLWAGTLVAFTIHNAEEVIAFSSGWSAHHLPRLSSTVSYWPGFAIAATALTLLAILVVFALRNHPRTSSRLLQIFLWVMLGNVLWHISVRFTPVLLPRALSPLSFYCFRFTVSTLLDCPRPIMGVPPNNSFKPNPLHCFVQMCCCPIAATHRLARCGSA